MDGEEQAVLRFAEPNADGFGSGGVEFVFAEMNRIADVQACAARGRWEPGQHKKTFRLTPQIKYHVEATPGLETARKVADKYNLRITT